MPIFEVSTIQTFRHKYVIEAESLEHAYDTIVMQEAEELTQRWLGEEIIDGREVTKEEIERIAKEYRNDKRELCNQLEYVYHKVEYEETPKTKNRVGEPCDSCATPLTVREGTTYCPSCGRFF